MTNQNFSASTTWSDEIDVSGDTVVTVAPHAVVSLLGMVRGTNAASDRLVVSGGGSLSLTAPTPGLDAIAVSGAGTFLELGAAATIGALAIGDGSIVHPDGTLNGVAVHIQGSATLDVAAGGVVPVRMPGVASGIGRLAVTGGGTLLVSAAGPVRFSVATGAEIIGATAGALDTQVLTDFRPGDVLDVSDLDPTLTGVTAGYDAATGQLQIRQNAVLRATVTLQARLSGTFTVVTDGNHGAAIQLVGDPDAAAVRAAAATAIRAQAATALYGVDGTGVTIGIISSSFNTLGGAAQDIASGSLPIGLRILSDVASPSTDEGRSMAQVIHAAAPGAAILFAQSGDSAESMAAAVASLIQAGARVIVDDVGLTDEPFWQSAGALNQAIDAATAAGIVFVTAAGNAGHAYYEHQYTLTDTVLPGGIGASHAYDFGLGQGAPAFLQAVTMASGGLHAVTLQWDQPVGQVTKALTLHVLQLQQDGTSLEVGMPSQATNGTAAEETVFQGAGTFLFAITGTDQGDSGRLKYLVAENGGGVTIHDPHAGQGTGDVFGHALNANEITVAESLYTSPTVTTNSSGTGPGAYLFDPAGTRLAQPQPLGKPDITAPVGAATDSTGVLTSFTGTSAAAPGVAAVVALMLQANPGLTPAQVKAALQASALAMAGPASASGAGLVQADAAVALGRAGTTRLATAGQTLVAGDGRGGQLVGAVDGPSTLIGGAGGTSFVARGGATRIVGGAGFDTIQAGTGDVTVAGGAGGSLVSLGSGAALVGVAAGSIVLGGTGPGTIATTGTTLVGLGAGPAFVFAGAGGTVVGGAGATLVAAREGGVIAFGGAGSTVFIGGTAASTVAGGQGSGTVFGGDGGGLFSGGAAGHTVLVGGQGAATLFGGGDGDVLFATGPAGTTLVAGSGNETLQGAGSSGNDVFFTGPGTALVGLGSGQDRVFAGSGSSTVVGGTGSDTYAVVNGQAGGSMSIYGFKMGIDHLSLAGFDAAEGARALGSALQDPAGPRSGPATTITLSDNTRISFLGLGGLDARVLG